MSDRAAGAAPGDGGAGSAEDLARLLEAAEPDAPQALAGLARRLRHEERLDEAVSADGAHVPGDLELLASVPLTGVAHDSRDVRPGSVFVAIPGARVDGHAMALGAVAAGAVAVVVERLLPGLAVPQLVVEDSRRALATAACWWYGDPSHHLAVVGVTGTDGKTSTSRLVVSALGTAGLRTGMSSTAVLRVGGRDVANPVHATTPEAPEMQRLLRAMTNAGDRCAVVETTSHGLAADRVAGVAYDAAILTNVTHEHLEFHGTFEAYRAAKIRLFGALQTGDANPRKGPGGAGGNGAWPKSAVVNADDPSAPLFVAAARTAGARVVTYGESSGADVRLAGVEARPDGLLVEVDGPGGRMHVRVGLLGRFNAWNALAVVGLAEAVGLDLDAVLAGIADAPPVKGRMERVDRGQPFTVVVDFAHSPASLQLVLDELGTVAAAAGGGLIAVFGSAGERDVAKRPMMGRVAGERCRVVVATDEDPRGEDRVAILEQIAAGAEAVGLRRGEGLYLIPDRREAIARAFRLARAGDVVVLAGKGHETEIIGRDGAIPWDERAVAQEELDRLRG
jgi:UDP-N-acetylmuramoyl-L-alanyl-D-glutamate--2,6-diaminopimelate ligase